MPGSRRALIVVIAAALGGALPAPAAAQVSERCLGTPTLCEATFSMAGGASDKQISCSQGRGPASRTASSHAATSVGG